MRKIPDRLVLLILCLLVLVGAILTLSYCTLTIPQRILMGLIIGGLFISCVVIWHGPIYSHNETSYKIDDLAEQIMGDPILWVRAGLIPPTRIIAKRMITNRDIEEAIETLNKRSINRNMAVWTFNNLMAKESHWFKNKNWGMNLDSLVQIDYGVGDTKMVYYIDKKIKIPILTVWLSWRNDKPIFYFHGIMSMKASRIWRNFLQNVNSKSSFDKP